MKRIYIQPACEVVEIQNCSIVCESPVRDVTGNSDLKDGGGGDVPARARESIGVDWNDWE